MSVGTGIYLTWGARTFTPPPYLLIPLLSLSLSPASPALGWAMGYERLMHLQRHVWNQITVQSSSCEPDLPYSSPFLTTVKDGVNYLQLHTINCILHSPYRDKKQDRDDFSTTMIFFNHDSDRVSISHIPCNQIVSYEEKWCCHVFSISSHRPSTWAPTTPPFLISVELRLHHRERCEGATHNNVTLH